MRGLRGWQLSCIVLALTGLVPVRASAADAELDMCRTALQRAGEDPESELESLATLTIGPHRVIVGDTLNGGFVCLLGAKGPRSVVSDVVVGRDVVGRIAHPRVLTVAGQPLLATVQTFRGGSNHRRQFHVLYAFVQGKIRTALQLPEHAALAIGNYALSESNELTPKPTSLHVAQQTAMSVREGKGPALYRAAREFDLVWSAEFSSLIEGVGSCVQDYEVDRKVWLRKGQRFGYLFRPGMADAGGLTLTLVRQDGATATVADLEDLTFLRLGESRS